MGQQWKPNPVLTQSARQAAAAKPAAEKEPKKDGSKPPKKEK